MSEDHMSDKEAAQDAFAALYHAKDNFEAAIKLAMDILWEPEGEKWDVAYKAAEAVYEDMTMWENLQTTIDALEELADE